MVGMDYLSRTQGSKDVKMNAGASLSTENDLYTVEYTVTYTVTYTVRTVSGNFKRLFTIIYELEIAQNIKRISPYLTFYR